MRVEVRAVIFRDGKLLLAKEQRNGDHLSLPGGRLNDYETVEEALVREVKEETGLDARPGPLLYVAESTLQYRLHDLNLVFLSEASGPLDPGRCELVEPGEVEPGTILPPILGEIGRDLASGWRETPRWLGNIWDAGLT
jgi:ADP-ribose pyrophosphatase YjhB (NUDIX family)